MMADNAQQSLGVLLQILQESLTQKLTILTEIEAKSKAQGEMVANPAITLEELDANTLDFKKIRFLDMRNCKNLYSVSFRNADLTQTNTVFIPRSIRKIDIDYARLSRPLNYRLNYIQNLLNTSRNNVVAILFKRSSKEPSL